MIGTTTEAPHDDASLLAASKAGDVAAFGALIERYHNLVCAIAYSRTGDRIASEDIAQETFLAAWNGLAALRDSTKLRSWLCGITRNVAGKALRTRRREPIHDVDDLEGELAGDSGPLSAMLTKEIETTVWAALEGLPTTYREPLVLFYREQQSIKQVALGLGLSEQTAKQRLSRGRESLRENIGDLVEKTLQAGRPRKAAAAAVVAAIMAAQGTSKAVAATHVTRTAGRGYVLAGVGTLVCAAIAVAIFVGTSRSASQERAPTTGAGNANIMELRRAHAAWKATTPHAQTCELRGTVTRADRSPIANALVAIVGHSWQMSTALEPLVVETDARGRWTTLALAAGSYSVSVSAPGARATTRIVTCARSGSEEQAFALQPTGALLRGSVSDVGGGPIAGVTVWVTDSQRSATGFLTRTNADGAYEILVQPGLYTILLTHPEYTLDVRPVTLGSIGAREDITLLPGASIEGTVVDGAAAPVPHAKVAAIAPSFQVRGTPARWQLASMYSAMLPVVADANGRFRLRGLPPGTVRIGARAGALSTTNAPTVDLGLAQQHTGATVTVAAGRSISGFVVARGAESRGLESVQLLALREDAPLALPTIATTDGAGSFELAGLTPGQYRLTAIATGFAPHVAENLTTIASRDAPDTIVVLDRGVPVTGRIDPATDASIKLMPAAAATSAVSYIKAAMTRVELGNDGTFTFPAVAPGDYVITAATFERHGAQSITVTNRAAAALHMTLAPRPAITGHVVDDTGTKLAGVLVAASASRTADPTAAMHTTVRTNADGAFTILGIAAGPHEIRVFDANGQRPWAGAPAEPFDARELDVPATGSVVETLRVASGGGRITGVVTGPDGRPALDAWIDVQVKGASHRPPLFPSPPVVTDAAGRFAINGLFGSELTINASAIDGTHRAAITATVGAHVELQLRPMSRLVGNVQRDGKPVATFDVRLRHKSTRGSREERGAAGAFAISIMPGDYELTVTSESGYARQPITVGSDPASLDLTLTPWSSVRGRVVGVDGKPWSNASLLLHNSVEPKPLRTDAVGAFTIERASAGDNKLSIMHGTASDHFMFTFELAPGQQLDLDTISPRPEPPTTGNELKDLQSSVSALRPQTTASFSKDLGIQMFVSVNPPTAAMLAALKTDPMLASREGKTSEARLWIAGVAPGGHAERAGLRAGDRIMGIGMANINDGASAVDMMSSLTRPWRSKGRAVRWTVIRGASDLKIDLLVPK